MTEQPLPNVVEAEALTEMLHRFGGLNGGRVRQVTPLRDRTTILSRIIRLRLSYDTPAGDAPSTIILKTGLPQRAALGSRGGAREVTFYRDVASATHMRFVPRCFDAHWDAESNDWHLLLDDLTESHFTATVWPLPPATEQCESVSCSRWMIAVAAIC